MYHIKAVGVVPGAVYGQLTVVERLPREWRKSYWVYPVRCSCSCGKESIVSILCLTRGTTTSCGCHKVEVARKNARKHMKPGEGMNKIFPGAVFGRLTVIERVKVDGKLVNRARCKCVCGKETRSDVSSLIDGTTKSCGCLAREKLAKRNRKLATRGGFCVDHTLTYRSWYHMNLRCYNEKSVNYPYYGGRGVFVCDWLREKPENLMSLIGEIPEETYTVDRFPNKKGSYTCGKCGHCVENGWLCNIRWATKKEQANNKISNVRVTAFGMTKTVSEWSDLTKMRYETLRLRIKKGWDHEKALTTPDKFGNCYKVE